MTALTSLMAAIWFWPQCVNKLRLRQKGRHFADDIFKCIFLNENVWIPNKILLRFILKGPINDIPALVQIMAWRRPGIKPLSEPIKVSLPTHICVNLLQWVNSWITAIKQISKGSRQRRHTLSVYIFMHKSIITLNTCNLEIDQIIKHDIEYIINNGPGICFCHGRVICPMVTEQSISVATGQTIPRVYLTLGAEI